MGFILLFWPVIYVAVIIFVSRKSDHVKKYIVGGVVHIVLWFVLLVLAIDVFPEYIRALSDDMFVRVLSICLSLFLYSLVGLPLLSKKIVTKRVDKEQHVSNIKKWGIILSVIIGFVLLTIGIMLYLDYLFL